MKRTLLILTITVLVIGHWSLVTAHAAGFGDLPPNHYYAKAFTYLQDKGIIKGYADNTVRPDSPINRAELMKMVVEGFKMSVIVPETPCFSDIQLSDWFTPYLCTAKERGIISGLPDGSFQPVRNVNKAETLKILTLVTGISAKTTVSQFSDIKSDAWFAPYIIAAEEGNYLEETGLEFHPTEDYSRGQVAEILYRILSTQEQGKDRFAEDATSPPMTADEITMLQRQIFAFDQINDIRGKAGAGPLKLNPLLSNIATIHSQDMALFIKTMSHKGSLGEEAYEREQSGKVPDLNTHTFTTVAFPGNIDRAGENVGKRNINDFGGSVEDAIISQHNFFLDEQDKVINHRTIMLSSIIPFSEVGIGLALDADGNLWITEDYISTKQ